MGTHFLGQKRLKKISNKFNHIFLSGYEYYHEKGYKLYILKDENFDYVLLITKQNKYVLKKIPFGVCNSLSRNIRIDFSCDEPYLSTIYSNKIIVPTVYPVN
jgi:hypothetical protein